MESVSQRKWYGMKIGGGATYDVLKYLAENLCKFLVKPKWLPSIWWWFCDGNFYKSKIFWNIHPLTCLHWSDAPSRRRRLAKGSLLQKLRRRRSSCFYTNFELTHSEEEGRHWFYNWLERPKWNGNIFMGSSMHWVSLPAGWARHILRRSQRQISDD